MTPRKASPRSGRNSRTTPRRRGSSSPPNRAAPACLPQAAAAPPPPVPAMPEQERLRYVWGILNDCIEKSGGYSNLDFGGAGRFANQQQLHDAITGMMKRSAGNMHVKSSP